MCIISMLNTEQCKCKIQNSPAVCKRKNKLKTHQWDSAKTCTKNKTTLSFMCCVLVCVTYLVYYCTVYQFQMDLFFNFPLHKISRKHVLYHHQLQQRLFRLSWVGSQKQFVSEPFITSVNMLQWTETGTLTSLGLKQHWKKRKKNQRQKKKPPATAWNQNSSK